MVERYCESSCIPIVDDAIVVVAAAAAAAAAILLGGGDVNKQTTTNNNKWPTSADRYAHRHPIQVCMCM